MLKMCGVRQTVKIYFVILICLFCCLSCEGLKYGEACDLSNDFCDASKYLQCGVFSRTCECKNAPQTWYDLKAEVCKLKVGVDCEPGINEQQCVENAFCNPTLSPVCTCNEDYEENHESRCFLMYDFECQKLDDRCDPAGFLKCTEINNAFYCKCQEFENSIYNPVTKTCNLLWDADCPVTNNSMSCVQNAFCDPYERKCRCQGGSNNTPDRMCYLPYGSECDLSNDFCNSMGHIACDTELAKCLCRPEWESIYYPSEKGCRLLENAGCSIMEGSQRCIDDAECLPSEGSEPRRCKCSYNLSSNKNRECFLTHGANCDRLQNYCDPAGFLTCGGDNSCTCLNSNSFYDANAKECRFALNAKCKPGIEEQPCGNNAFCDLIEEVCQCNSSYEDAGDGRNCLRSFGTPCSALDPCSDGNFLYCVEGYCRCTPGFVDSRINTTNNKYDTTCLPGYQQSCPYGEDLQLECAPEALLACSNGICNCKAPGHQIYIPELERCAILEGNECQMIGNNNSFCIQNATCVGADSEFGTGKCACNFGFKPSVFGYCASFATKIHLNAKFEFFVIMLLLYYII